MFIPASQTVRLGCPPQPHPFFNDRPPRYHAGSVIMPEPPGQPDWDAKMRDLWRNRVVAYYPRPGTSLRWLLLAIMNLFRPGKALYPSQIWLARHSRCCDKTVRRWLARLVEVGFMVMIRRRTDDDQQTSNAYLLCFPDDPPRGYFEKCPSSLEQDFLAVEDNPAAPPVTLGRATFVGSFFTDTCNVGASGARECRAVGGPVSDPFQELGLAAGEVAAGAVLTDQVGDAGQVGGFPDLGFHSGIGPATKQSVGELGGTGFGADVAPPVAVQLGPDPAPLTAPVGPSGLFAPDDPGFGGKRFDFHTQKDGRHDGSPESVVVEVFRQGGSANSGVSIRRRGVDPRGIGFEVRASRLARPELTQHVADFAGDDRSRINRVSPQHVGDLVADLEVRVPDD